MPLFVRIRKSLITFYSRVEGLHCSEVADVMGPSQQVLPPHNIVVVIDSLSLKWCHTQRKINT